MISCGIALLAGNLILLSINVLCLAACSDEAALWNWAQILHHIFFSATYKKIKLSSVLLVNFIKTNDCVCLWKLSNFTSSVGKFAYYVWSDVQRCLHACKTYTSIQMYWFRIATEPITCFFSGWNFAKFYYSHNLL